MSQEDLEMNLDIDEQDLITEGTETVYEDAQETLYGVQVNDKVEPEVVKIDKTVPRVKKIYSCMVMPNDLWEDVIGSIELVTMANYSYKETMDLLIEEIVENTPKEMTIFCFHELIYSMCTEQLLEGCNYLLKMVELTNFHKISFCCAPFPPDKQKFWYRIGLYNAETRLLNIYRNIPPLPLHKCLMKNQNEDGTGPCIIKGYMWKEYCERTGLGSTPSRDGFSKIKRQLVLAVSHQFIDMKRRPSRRWPGTINPPPLCTNDDYLKKPIMVKFLKEKDEFNIRHDDTKKAPAFEQQAKKSSSTSDIQEGASATVAERRLDSQERPRPATWYGQNLSVNFQPLGQRRKVFAPPINDEEFEMDTEQAPINKAEDKKQKTVCNEVNNSSKPIQEKSNEELLREIRKLKADKTHALSEQLRREEYLKGRIDNLHDLLDTEETDNKKYEKEAVRSKKEIEQLKLDIEAFKIEKELRETKVVKLQHDLDNKTATAEMLKDQVKLLTDQYKFIKQLHDEKSAYKDMLTDDLAKKMSTKKNRKNK